MNLPSGLEFLKSILRKPVAVPAIYVLALIFRIIALIYSGQLHTNEYWEYGLIAQNLINGNGYSFPFIDPELNFLKEVYPSALMPPGYVFFLYPFLLISSESIRNLLLFSVQIGLSLLALRLFYQWIKEKSGYWVALFTLILLAFLPDLVYAPATVGPTVWFHFLLSLFFWLQLKNGGFRIWIFQAIAAGILVLMRSESILLFAILGLIEIVKGNWKWSFTLIAGIAIIISPWLIRNYNTFGTPVLSANAGVNFYRGNNPGEIGDWPPVWNDTYVKLKQNPQTFEKEYDKYVMSLATDYIRQNPVEWITRMPTKIYRFWVIDWPDKRTHSPLYWLPWILCLAFGILGIIKSDLKNYQSVILVLTIYTLVILIFFPQLRYQTMVKWFFLPFTGLGIKACVSVFYQKYRANRASI